MGIFWIYNEYSINRNTPNMNYTLNGYDQFLTINNLRPSLEEGITNANSNAIIGVGAIGFGQTTMNVLYPNQDMQSQNFVTGVSGWQIQGDGDVEFGSGTFRGTITATGGAIGGWTINATSIYTGTEDHSGYTANAGDMTIYSDGSNSSLHAFKWYVDINGVLYCTDAVVSGGITTTSGSSLDGQYLTAGSVASASANLALRGWTFTSIFSSTDYDTVAWTAGTFTSSDGTAYSINAGNTGNIVALTYVYLDIAVSTTVLQTTTTAATAIGNGKVLIAIAKNNADTTSDATFQVFGGSGGQTLLVDNIAANSASTNEFVSNTAQIANLVVTNAKINDLAVSKLTTGSILSKQITLGVTGGSGDVYIASGKTDFTNTDSGFILGVDDSDSDKAKFYIGDSVNYLNWNGANLSVTAITKGIINKTAGIALTVGQTVVIYTDGKAYSTDALVATMTNTFLGICLVTTVKDSSAPILVTGVYDAFSSLSVGTNYYLSDATHTVDQNCGTGATNRTMDNAEGRWQSFTVGAGITHLTRIRVWLGNNSDNAVTVKIRVGTGNTGTLLDTFTIPAASATGSPGNRYGYCNFPIPVTAGQVYTITLSEVSSTMTWQDDNGLNTYAGGRNDQNANNDYQFSTYYTTGRGTIGTSAGTNSKKIGLSLSATETLILNT
jgi:hypothetical protein